MTEGKKYWGVPAPSRSDLRKFGAMMAVVLGLIAGYLWYLNALEAMQAVGAVAMGFLAVGLVVPVALLPIFVPWMWLAQGLSFVNTHLLLGLVFYTMFTFIGLCMRLLGHDPLDRKLAPDQKSYWQRRESSLTSREHYRKQF